MILNIFINFYFRLEMNGVPNDVIAPRAIAYLAGKISTLSGDIRKALDVCRYILSSQPTPATSGKR